MIFCNIVKSNILSVFKSLSQSPKVDLVSLNIPTVKNEIIPNIMTTLKLTLTLKPKVPQTIYFQLYAPGSPPDYIFVPPILLSQCLSLSYVNITSGSLNNTVYITVDRGYYEGIETDKTSSASNEINYYIPFFIPNNTTPLVNLTYNLTTNSLSSFGNYIFTTTAPALFNTSLSVTFTPNTPAPTTLYTQMCGGVEFPFTLTFYWLERRCSYFTQWINRIVNDTTVLTSGSMSFNSSGTDVILPDSYTMNITYVDSYMKVDYGPICTININDYETIMDYSFYLVVDCNVTSPVNYTFPITINLSGSDKNFTTNSVGISIVPNFTDYTTITSQLKPTNLTLQPGQKTTINMQYTFPLNSSYPKSTIQVIGTEPNSTNETIMTIIGFTITWGSNLFPMTTAYSYKYSSIYQTDQMDQLTIYFERITNNGTVIVPHVRNTINISVDIQLSDSRSVEKGTTWPLQFIGQFNNITTSDIVSVYCWRSGSEVPSINVSLSQLSLSTLSDCPDRDEVYLQIVVQLMNGIGLECERQSLFFYLSPQIKSISLFKKSGSISNIILANPLNSVTKSVQFTTGRLYFGATYAAIFKLKYNPSLHKSVAKYPVLAEVVCKPYERNIPVATGCSRSKFYRFMARLYVELDYTYPCDLPHYIAIRNSYVQLPNRQTNTFLNVGDLLFYCGRAFSTKGSHDLERRCFMISKLPDRIWFDMGPYVEQIVAYTIPHGVLFGMGSNGGGVVMSKDFGNTWVSINPFAFHKTLNTSTQIITSSVLPWISLTGPVDNALVNSFCTYQVAGQWKLCFNEIYTNQILSANWTDKCPNINPF
ncbi:hypothetical protein KSF78_0006225 [Schistosoma japonicum]|nr:hypothetical protein KSF78_0006225 [Schistosoma japonicum]